MQMQMPKGKEETRGIEIVIGICQFGVETEKEEESFHVEKWGDGLCLMGAWAKRPHSPNGIFKIWVGQMHPIPNKWVHPC